MLIQFTPDQVSSFWEMIRYALVTTNHIPEGQEQDFLNKTLANILSGKAQVWVGFDKSGPEKTFVGIIITYTELDELYNMKFLTIDTIYAYNPVHESKYIEYVETLKTYAKNIGCPKLRARTSYPRVQELLALTGFKESTIKVYEL